ncbi:MAG: NrsF family protein [Kofleriaceae bacterium]
MTTETHQGHASERAQDALLQQVFPPPAPPEIGAALDAELAALQPVRTRRPVRDALLIAGSGLAIVAAMLAVMRVREDLLELPLGWLVVMAAAWFLGFLVPAWLVVVPPRGQMMGRWRGAALAGGVSAGLFLLVGFVHSPSSGGSPVSPPYHPGCLGVGLLASLVPIALAALVVRGAFPVGARWAAAALGAAGGALGGLFLHFHCAIVDPMHVGLMHGGVVVVAAILSALVVPRATDAAFRER